MKHLKNLQTVVSKRKAMRNRSSTKSSQRFDIGAVKWYLIIRRRHYANNKG